MEDGKLFIHGDDPYLLRYAPPGAVTVSCTNQTSLCYATNIELTAHGTTFDFTSPVGTWRKVYINTIGEHTLSCALFGIAVAQAVSVPHDVICRNLLAYEPIYQRQSILHLGEVTIILDAYNACPASMKAALQTAHLLAQETGGNVIACLGDMLELGRNSCVYHEEIGRACAKAGVTHLFTIGNYASFYQNGAISAGLSSQQVTALNNLPTSMQVATILPSLKPKSILLLKGSRKNRLENLLPYLKSSLS